MVHIQTIGFDKKPYSTIFWFRGNDAMSKTICFSLDDELDAKRRFYTPGDFYNGYKKAFIFRGNKEKLVLEKEE